MRRRRHLFGDATFSSGEMSIISMTTDGPRTTTCPKCPSPLSTFDADNVRFDRVRRRTRRRILCRSYLLFFSFVNNTGSYTVESYGGDATHRTSNVFSNGWASTIVRSSARSIDRSLVRSYHTTRRDCDDDDDDNNDVDVLGELF